MTPKEAIAEIKQLEGCYEARYWAKNGYARIYVSTVKQNGGRAWNGGLGYSDCYLDLVERKVVMRGKAGAKTRDYHDRIETKENLEKILERTETPPDVEAGT